MPIDGDYRTPEPTRAEVESWSGPAVLEFGTGWCGFCQAAQPLIRPALANFPAVRHVQIEDGPGRRLGRAYRVKLWPTLVFLKDGVELARVVRPQAMDEIQSGLSAIVG